MPEFGRVKTDGQIRRRAGPERSATIGAETGRHVHRDHPHRFGPQSVKGAQDLPEMSLDGSGKPRAENRVEDESRMLPMAERDRPEASAPRPAEPASADDPRVTAFRELLGIVDRLRAPDGCPWDREQTEESMAPHLVEEAFELSEAIRGEEPDAVAVEAGDVLLNVLLICRIAEDGGRYDLARAAELVSDKLVRRHPHVFGEVRADTSREVLRNWDEIKKAEREAQEADASVLAGLPRAMPALLRAKRVCERAVAAGFAWPSWRGALAKLVEETGELEREADAAGDVDPQRVAEELGDVLLAAAFLAQYLGRDPDGLCRDALDRFEARFRSMEAAFGGSLAGRSLDELIAGWQAAKRAEAAAAAGQEAVFPEPPGS